MSFFGWILAQGSELPLLTPPAPKEYAEKQKKWFVPKRPLTAYSSNPLLLQTTPYTLTLPDLRNVVVYYGKNMRPDTKDLYFIGLENEESIATVEEGEPLYIKYQGDSSYTLSPHNEPTALWLEMRAMGTQAEIRVTLVDEDQHKVAAIEELSSFKLPSKQMIQGQEWHLGKHRVDATLLVRQKARFVGEDLFLQMHGGSEYAHFEGCSRLDFLDAPEAYSCFVKPGDFLVWEEEKWRSLKEVESSQGKPLLVIQTIDERMMHCELWDELGSKKMQLNILRLKDHYGMPDVQADFHFIQSKTWSQFIVECRGKKMTLRPNDWLLLTEEGWEKIDTLEKLEAYVSHKLSGPLLVIGKLKKEEGEQILSAHLFNMTRSVCSDVKLAQKKSASQPVIQAVRSLTQKSIHNEVHPRTQGNHYE